MNAIAYKPIEKEHVAELKFPSEEVLSSQADIVERRMELERALKLGNMEQHKIRIFFEDDSCPKMVETTVWGVTDKRVILKHGLVIPIHRVRSVRV